MSEGFSPLVKILMEVIVLFVLKQMKRGLAIRASTESELSRRKILLAGVSTLGLLLLPNSRAAEARNKDPDMREQIMEDIENFQKRVSKTLEEAKKAVTSMA